MRLRRPLPAVQGDTLHIVGVGDNRIGKDFTYKATHIFNANAFPDSLKGEIGACVTRMRVFQHSVREVCVQISLPIRLSPTPTICSVHPFS